MVTLDPADVLSRSEPREGSERIVRQCDNFTVLVEEKSAVLVILRSRQWQEKSGFHVNRAMKAEELNDSVMYDTIESGMVRDVDV